MSDIADLHGVFPTPFRWHAEHGIAGVSMYNEAIGERELKEIEPGSPAAKFVMDYATRERGYGKIAPGIYTMILTPVGSSPPDWPGDDDFKPAIGVWLWNPVLGELRLEANGSIVVRAVSELWARCRSFK